MNEKEIIQLILKGDREKYRLLVEKYQNMVFRICIGFVHNKEDAEDLTQEIFIRAYQSLSQFKGNAAFSTWLYRISINMSLNKINRSPLKSFFNSRDEKHETAGSVENISIFSDNEDPEKIMITREHSEWLRKAVDSLPDKQKTALVLSRYDGLSQREIAEIINTTEGAVESLLQRAKNKLRILLANSRKDY
ncbi:MAG TPA: RNA polymerase sigma factor [Bacteroidales bacterium]|nr:RNA polymerase sigma factor [Bacteroidales bacterium]HPI68286.1 RNA polymerase sigma factor [Bacteroidales bacterium]HPR72882.1 RNA polymerase sigma factor [Bacteroidales bacterium]